MFSLFEIIQIFQLRSENDWENLGKPCHCSIMPSHFLYAAVLALWVANISIEMQPPAFGDGFVQLPSETLPTLYYKTRACMRCWSNIEKVFSGHMSRLLMWKCDLIHFTSFAPAPRKISRLNGLRGRVEIEWYILRIIINNLDNSHFHHNAVDLNIALTSGEDLFWKNTALKTLVNQGFYFLVPGRSIRNGQGPPQMILTIGS